MFKQRLSKILTINLFIYFFVFLHNAQAQLLTADGREDVLKNMYHAGKEADYNTAGRVGHYLLANVAGKFFAVFLSLLGIIFLIMIIIGGFNWMTAAGNDDKISKAKATLYRGIIGLIIVVTAYIITAFVFRALGGLVGNSL